jgi:hypothetical protein
VRAKLLTLRFVIVKVRRALQRVLLKRALGKGFHRVDCQSQLQFLTDGSIRHGLEILPVCYILNRWLIFNQSFTLEGWTKQGLIGLSP